MESGGWDGERSTTCGRDILEETSIRINLDIVMETGEHKHGSMSEGAGGARGRNPQNTLSEQRGQTRLLLLHGRTALAQAPAFLPCIVRAPVPRPLRQSATLVPSQLPLAFCV